MKLNIFWIGLFVLVSNLSLAQTDTVKVPFVAYWKVGDSYDFQITKIKEQWRGDTIEKKDSSAYIANFKVIDSTENSYTIKWSYKTSLAEFDIPDNISEKLSKYTLNELIYKTDELGTYQGLQNWEEVSAMMKNLMTSLMEELSLTQSNTELKDKIEPVFAAYYTKQGIEQMLMQEISIMHWPMGVEFLTSESLEYEEELANIFGGSPLRSTVKMDFEEVDLDNSFCIFRKEQKLNPEDSKNMILGLLGKLATSKEEMEREMGNSTFTIADNYYYEYYFNPGVPSFIEYKREAFIDVKSEKGKRIDIKRIELLLDDEEE